MNIREKLDARKKKSPSSERDERRKLYQREANDAIFRFLTGFLAVYIPVTLLTFLLLR